MSEPRVAVVGATGAVGQVTLRLLRERGYTDVRAFASKRSAGQTLDDGRDDRRGDARSACGGRHRSRALLRRHVGVARARAARGARRRRRRRQVVRLPARAGHPARRAGGERRPRARARRHRREPELLHDPAHLRPEAAARRGGPAPRARVDLPVGVGRGRAADGAAPRRAPGRARPRDGLELGRRRDRRGVEDPRRDAEDPRAARPAAERDDRARPDPRRACRSSVGRARGRALRGAGDRAASQRTVGARRRRADSAARRRRPTRCSSAGSGPTAPPRTASRSSSPATTSSKARRSTPSRSPSCC